MKDTKLPSELSGSRARPEKQNGKENPKAPDSRDRGFVTVWGPLGECLLSSASARQIQIHGKSGDLSAVAIRISPSVWGISVKGDADWEEISGKSYMKDSFPGGQGE